MRNLAEVIDRVIPLIPTQEDLLLADLLGIRESLMYSAPESQFIWWQEMAKVLAAELPEPPDCKDWQKEVCAVWFDTEES